MSVYLDAIPTGILLTGAFFIRRRPRSKMSSNRSSSSLSSDSNNDGSGKLVLCFPVVDGPEIVKNKKILLSNLYNTLTPKNVFKM